MSTCYTQSIYGEVLKSSDIIEAYGKLDELYWTLAKQADTYPFFGRDIQIDKVLSNINALYSYIGLRRENGITLLPPPVAGGSLEDFCYNRNNPLLIDMHLCRVKCRETERACIRADEVTCTAPKFLNSLGTNLFKLISFYASTRC